MSGEWPARSVRAARLIVLGLVGVIIVLGLALVLLAIGSQAVPQRPAQIDALATSADACVTCHRSETPGIVEQYARSSMAAAEVGCRNCHQVAADHPGAVAHEGTFVLSQPTPAMCERCHSEEVAQFYQSRHSLPAYVAIAGATDLSPEHMAMYAAIPEGSYNPDRTRHALYAIEGPDITPLACASCHNVGRPQPDGSVGECQQCHLRHEFSLEQVRKPETCNACHIGPDHPQWEIYQESPHGIAYATGGSLWQWDADPGALTAREFPAPTCAICHFSGFGASGTTHDVGDRLTWYLFAPISERRPSWQDNLVRMQDVCRECHNDVFISDFYAAADAATGAVNDWVMQPLVDRHLLTDEPFDESIDFVYFELWHHWGRTAKFGAWMQGPDYTQWHGAYEVLSDLVELREMVADRLAEVGAGQ
jgi:hydroxylamine dehydrogenase